MSSAFQKIARAREQIFRNCDALKCPMYSYRHLPVAMAVTDKGDVSAGFFFIARHMYSHLFQMDKSNPHQPMAESDFQVNIEETLKQTRQSGTRLMREDR
jgi:hypothetical protein